MFNSLFNSFHGFSSVLYTLPGCYSFPPSTTSAEAASWYIFRCQHPAGQQCADGVFQPQYLCHLPGGADFGGRDPQVWCGSAASALSWHSQTGWRWRCWKCLCWVSDCTRCSAWEALSLAHRLRFHPRRPGGHGRLLDLERDYNGSRGPELSEEALPTVVFLLWDFNSSPEVARFSWTPEGE